MTYLLIVEGEKSEFEIFSKVFERYGFNVVHADRMKSLDSSLEGFDISELEDNKNNVVIAQAPKNRLGELLKLSSEQFDFDMAFRRQFNGVFLIFDVDHTSRTDLEEMIGIHNDETDKGLLLVSSPCIEILSEPGRKEPIETDHLSTYKKERNIYCSDVLRLGHGTTKYISDNFEALALQFLDQNYKDFSEVNVMEHPQQIIEKINKENERTSREVVYRYFTTVVYVVIAVVFGLSREIENYESVRRFLKDHIVSIS